MIVIGYQTINTETNMLEETIFEEHEVDDDVIESMERLIAQESNNDSIHNFFFANRLSPDEYTIYARYDK